MDETKSYRLNSMDEPTDERLEALMVQVGEDARESSRRAKAEPARLPRLHVCCMTSGAQSLFDAVE